MTRQVVIIISIVIVIALAAIVAWVVTRRSYSGIYNSTRRSRQRARNNQYRDMVDQKAENQALFPNTSLHDEFARKHKLEGRWEHAANTTKELIKRGPTGGVMAHPHGEITRNEHLNKLGNQTNNNLHHFYPKPPVNTSNQAPPVSDSSHSHRTMMY